jgi:hypothetical protein
MINYLLFLIIPPTIIYYSSIKKNSFFYWVLTFFFLLFLSTFRDQIGSDQGDYQITFMKHHYLTANKFIPIYEFFYSLIEFFSSKMKLGFHGVNMICSSIYLIGLILLIKDENRSWLCLFISLPYFYFAVSWGFLRQGLSLGFIFMSIYFFKQNKLIFMMIFSILAFLSHKFAIIFFPALFVSYFNSYFIKLITILSGVFIAIFIVYYSIYINSTYIEQFVTNIPEEYDSKGTHLRAIMSLIPSLLFLLKKKQMKKYNDYELYFYISLISIALFFLNFFFPIPIMRIGVFFGFLQFIIFPRLVDVFENQFKIVFTLLIVFAYLIVFFTWLTYSPHIDLWLPYKFSF